MYYCDKMPIWNFNIFICFYQWAWYKIRNILCYVTSLSWVYNPIGRLWAVFKYLLGLSELEYIRAIDVYIFCDSILYILFFSVLSIFVDLYALILVFSVLRWTFLYQVSSLGSISMKWSSDLHLKHVFGFRPLHSLCLSLELCGLKGFFLWTFSFICCLNYLSVGCEPQQCLHLDW